MSIPAAQPCRGPDIQKAAKRLLDAWFRMSFQEDMRTHKNLCTMFTGAAFVRAKEWKQPKHPSADDRGEGRVPHRGVLLSNKQGWTGLHAATRVNAYARLKGHPLCDLWMRNVHNKQSSRDRRQINGCLWLRREGERRSASQRAQACFWVMKMF